MIRLFKIYLTLAFLLVTTFCMAQKSELKFSKDGKFKIVQFTDVHFKYGNRASDIALERINQVLDDERPDLVIFTGDVVYSAPADSGMLQVLEPVVKRKLPFVGGMCAVKPSDARFPDAALARPVRGTVLRHHHLHGGASTGHRKLSGRHIRRCFPSLRGRGRAFLCGPLL